METKEKCILAMVTMCLLITPAFSQGGERDGPNGNPGSNNAMMSGPNGAPFGQVDEIKQGLAPDAPHDEPAPWTYIKPGDGQHDGAAFGFGGPNEQAPHRSIMDRDHPRAPPKKSLMEGSHHRMHKKPLKSLADKDFPELPPMKSIMNHGR